MYKRQELGGAGMSPMLRRQLPFVALAIFLVLFALVAPHNVVDIGVYALIYGCLLYTSRCV